MIFQLAKSKRMEVSIQSVTFEIRLCMMIKVIRCAHVDNNLDDPFQF